jgi:hypothetical protein
MTGMDAFVCNGRLDILPTNQLGNARYSPAHLDPHRSVNLARVRLAPPLPPRMRVRDRTEAH